MIKFILTDIEGTTTAIDFVHSTLFPYSYDRLETYIQQNGHMPHVIESLADVALTIKEELSGREPDHESCIQTLLKWIRNDRKHPALKKLQGYIWEEGYHNGSYQGHIYPDAYENIRNWLQQGLRLGIYSSGSVKAQHLLFGYSSYGDLNNLFAFNFDTSVGPKKEPKSYQKICHEIALPPEEIVFLSDSVEELMAAKEAKYNLIQVQRDENGQTNEKADKWPIAKDFFEADRIIRSL